MENASKALLIAAAVLIVILLIAFGMRIFNSSRTSTQKVDTVTSSIDSKIEAAAGEIESVQP